MKNVINDSQAILYNEKTGKIEIIDKQKVCQMISFNKLYNVKESMTYKEIVKENKLNKISDGIYNFKDIPQGRIVILINKTIDDFKKVLKKYNLPIFENREIYYHGSKEGLILPIQYDKGNPQCDFGQAFYVGKTVEQPEDLISDEENKNPTVYVFQPDLTGLSKYTFKNDEDWVLYIARNRNLKEITKNEKLMNYLSKFDKYDLLEGTIADDRFVSSLKEFFRHNIRLSTLIDCLDYFKYGIQLACKTQRACDRFNNSIIEQYKLSKEKMQKYIQNKEKRMMDIDVKLRELRDSQRNKPSNSPYFDEILKRFE